MKIFNIDGKYYYGIMRPDEVEEWEDRSDTQEAIAARTAFDKLEAIMKDDASLKEFLETSDSPRHELLQIIANVAWGLAIMHMPTDLDKALMEAGRPYVNLRDYFEPKYDGPAPF